MDDYIQEAMLGCIQMPSTTNVGSIVIEKLIETYDRLWNMS